MQEVSHAAEQLQNVAFMSAKQTEQAPDPPELPNPYAPNVRSEKRS